MKVSSVSAFALLLLGVVAAPSASPETVASTDPYQRKVEDLSSQILTTQLAALEAKNKELKKKGIKPTCTCKNIGLRKEYGALTRKEKLDYVKAVKCLRKLPAKTPKNIAPGARSRFDDFVVIHMQATQTIHFTGNFVTWHRLFTWHYEQALRNECGYKGHQPYWEWSRYLDPERAPMFDGSDTSLGSNGKFVPHNGTKISPPPGLGEVVQFPPGNGGGCVKKGLLSGEDVWLGPLGIEDLPVAPNGGLGKTPRCIKRDLGPFYVKTMAPWSRFYNLIRASTLAAHRLISEGTVFTSDIGLHGCGHFTIGGDPGGDFFVSPGDPAFYLHHSQMDRGYTLWQGFNPKRAKDIVGTITLNNVPPSRDAVATDILEMGYAGASLPIKDVLDTTGGPLCYLYI